jgi:hypothetical protein
MNAYITEQSHWKGFSRENRQPNRDGRNVGRGTGVERLEKPTKSLLNMNCFGLAPTLFIDLRNDEDSLSGSMMQLGLL